jgi:UDP-2,4-diacetamido-2,4,6-trideoxy-beta-L-altropyranose hydrolase
MDTTNLPHQPGTIILRADASTAMGTGHVMRCFAFAQAWQDAGGRPVFAIADAAPATRDRLIADDMKVVPLEISAGSEDDAARVIELAERYAADWVVVDGYQFGADYQRQLKAAGLKLLVVDDNGHAGHYCADLVLDQNAHAREELYENREPYTRLLLGPSYALLRREFARWLDWRRTFPTVAKRILVTMGGSDPEAMTLPVIKTLANFCADGVQLTVMVGGGNPRLVELRHAAPEVSSQIRLLTDVRDMAAVMMESDLAIICGGGTLWEGLYMGCAILTYFRPGVQEQIVGKLSTIGAVCNLGSIAQFEQSRLKEVVETVILSRQLRQSMAQQGRRTVDGRGTRRVLQALTGILRHKETDVRMERIVPEQRDAFLQMALRHFGELDPAFVPEADWTDAYFESIQRRRDCSLRWIVKDNEHIGFILFGVEDHRFLPRKTGAIWELYIIPERRRQGLATSCAQMAIEELWKLSPSKIQIEVVYGNERAVALWETLGFQRAATRFVLAPKTRR